MSDGLGDIFRDEARELLEELEQALLELEVSGQDAEPVEQVFRALHTIKGAGGVAGFDAVSDFTHEVETVFEKVRSGTLPVTVDLVTLTLAARDHIAAMIEGAADPFAGERLIAKLQALPCALRPASDSGVSAPKAPVSYRIRFRPPRDIFRRGIDPLALLRELAALGEVRPAVQVDAVPSLSELDPESCCLAWDVLLTTDAGVDAIRDVFIFVEDGELTITELGGPAPPAAVDALQAPRRDGAARTANAAVRVRAERLDALVDLVGELVTVQARLGQAVGGGESELGFIAEALERLTLELRDQVLSIRMLPIGSTFNKFRRLVRDLGESLDKDVELTTEGAETELDNTVLDRLHEPLVHLIRNGVDHGIEPPALRRAAGKAARGRVHLAASHAGPHVLIRIQDDGCGLDLASIRERAAAMGLIPVDAELSDREVCALVFSAGLSTAPSVTSVSGRGVGMDVVKRAVENLRGSIEVSSRKGAGTTFTVKLPLTLAIIDGLLVELGSDHFVLPLLAVEECIELDSRGADRAHGLHLINLRGGAVPYIRLRELLAVDGPPPVIEQIVVVRTEERRVGFVVDAVVGEHQTVIKSLGRLCRGGAGLAGATILGDGSVALILDLPQLIRMAESFQQVHAPGLRRG